MLGLTYTLLALGLTLTVSATPTPQGYKADFTCTDDLAGYYFRGAATSCGPAYSCDSSVTAGIPCVPRLAANVANNPSGPVNPGPSYTSLTPRPSTSAAVNNSGKKYIAYWSIWAAANTLPTAAQMKGITHLILSFADIETFGGWVHSDIPFPTTVISDLRREFPGVQLLAAFGGWNLDGPFRDGAKEANRATFAKNIANFVKNQGLDGADIDWEYPVNNGESYKLPETDPKARPYYKEDAQNYVELMRLIRKELGNTYILSHAVPGRPADLVAYNMTGIVTGLDESVDWWNLMTYDFINRRDSQTGHHAGGSVIEANLAMYKGLGVPKEKINIGFPMYAKWFILQTPCTSGTSGLGCAMGPFENEVGKDNDKSGTSVWNTALHLTGTPEALLASQTFPSVPWLTSSDDNAIASSYYNTTASMFWTWLSPSDIEKACKKYKDEGAGIFLWSLNQDTGAAAGGDHIAAMARCLEG